MTIPINDEPIFEYKWVPVAIETIIKVMVIDKLITTINILMILCFICVIPCNAFNVVLHVCHFVSAYFFWCVKYQTNMTINHTLLVENTNIKFIKNVI